MANGQAAKVGQQTGVSAAAGSLQRPARNQRPDIDVIRVLELDVRSISPIFVNGCRL